MVLTVVGVAALTWVLTGSNTWLRGQATQTAAATPSPVFSPAHRSFGSAFSNFFNIRPKPQQPIAYTHTVHINKVNLPCVYCHEGAETGSQASIPTINKCWECHESAATDRPEIKRIAALVEQKRDIEWQRVYGWVRESHVRFNHEPHFRNKIDCTTCHGDVSKMTVAEKVVNHTMDFCLSCHDGKKATRECMACHY